MVCEKQNVWPGHGGVWKEWKKQIREMFSKLKEIIVNSMCAFFPVYLFA